MNKGKNFWQVCVACGLILLAWSSQTLAYTDTERAQMAALSQLPPNEALEALSKSVHSGQARHEQEPSQLPTNAPTRPFRSQKPELNKQDAAEPHSNKDAPDELKPFGYALFATKTNSSVAVNDIPVSDNYIVGPGDELNLQLFGKINKEYNLVVGRDGMISIPELGPFSVSGNRFSQLETELSEKISEQISGVKPVISLGRLKTIQVYVMGDAYQPGAYNVHGLATVTQALLAAGGVADNGSLRRIYIKRGGKLVSKLDLYDLLIFGNNRADARLQSGDTIFIAPKGPELIIDGEVRRPAIYEMRGKVTLAQAMDMAGGLKTTAYPKAISIERMTIRGKVNQTIDLASKQGETFRLQAGDKIQVKAATDSLASGISLKGAVVREGGYRFQEGMHITDVIGSLEQDVLPEADLQYGIVVSYASKQGLKLERIIHVRQFSLEQALAEPKGAHNLELGQFDSILIFAKEKISNEAGEIVATELTDDTSTGNSTGVTARNAAGTKLKLSKAQWHDKKLEKYYRDALLEPVLEQLRQQSARLSPAHIVEIAGGVRYPGTYPLASEASLADLVSAAGGYREGAYLDYAELTHYQEQANGNAKLKREKLNLASGNGMILQTRMLKPRDRLLVLQRQNWRNEVVVELKGEVTFPGKYVVRKGDRISSVLERAGGITEYGYPQGSVYTRQTVKKREQEQMQRLRHELETDMVLKSMQLQKKQDTTDIGARTQLMDNIFNVEPVGRLVIDLARVEKVQGGVDDIVVENGDVLYVPGHTGTISIIGQVQGESTYLFDPKKTVDDYISMAGGPKSMADMKRVYVIRANGGFYQPSSSYWFNRKGNQLREGDTIVVPIDFNQTDKLTLWTSATQILYQTAVAWSAIHTTL